LTKDIHEIFPEKIVNNNYEFSKIHLDMNGNIYGLHIKYIKDKEVLFSIN